MTKVLAVLLAVAAAAAGAAAIVLYAGWYDVSATEQHLAPTYWALDTGMRRSVQRRAAAIAAPPLDDERLVARGLVHFRQHCVQCHGAPGVAPEPFALGMAPAPASLAYTAREWQPAELFWVIKYGIKMTGMPAWAFRLSDDDSWAVVAFLRVLPTLSPREYRAIGDGEGRVPALGREAEAAPEAPDPERGKTAIQQYACATCHRIPGIVGANAPVGPPLDGFANRTMLAGRLPNDGGNLARWLRQPQTLKPGSAMPDLGLTERDARDIAAYLLRP
jgi:mono/diheme cytochrome c family protein